MVIRSYIDTFGLLSFVFIFRPRLLPSYFEVFYDEYTNNNQINDLDHKFNIYKIKLDTRDGGVMNTAESTYFEVYPSKKGQKLKLFKDSPVIIINPYFERVKNVIDYIAIGNL